MAQIHYLVVYDTATKTWGIDNATINAILTEGVIYDTDEDKWRDPANEAEVELDKKLIAILYNKLQK
jgi:hypothetical protein